MVGFSLNSRRLLLGAVAVVGLLAGQIVWQTEAVLAAEGTAEQVEAETQGLVSQGDDGLRALEPGESFKDCDECPEMVVVPAGSFMMGSLMGEGYNNERPQHRVTIGYSFAAGKYEVTFAEWDACVSEGGCTHRPEDSWGRGQHPVMRVSWDDAQEYVRWLSGKTGEEYRLLSEAEWEYVARAGTTTAYSTGNSIASSQARFGGGGTVPVGSFSANRFGLHDVHGNVWEWTQDCRNESYSGAPSDGGAWERGNCAARVLRGGSWDGNPEDLRSPVRLRLVSGLRDFDLGFRVARSLN